MNTMMDSAKLDKLARKELSRRLASDAYGSVMELSSATLTWLLHQLDILDRSEALCGALTDDLGKAQEELGAARDALAEERAWLKALRVRAAYQAVELLKLVDGKKAVKA